MTAPAPTPRRGVAIKRADGEPLTRVDVQYDFLRAIFNDSHEVFTDPYTAKDGQATKVSFRDLYINTILHSPKATKALKDKMNESSLFAEDFAMLSLLVNVGRVNTTMSCEWLSFYGRHVHMQNVYHSLSGNEDDYPHLSPDSIAPEDEWEHAGCSSN